MMSVIFGGLGFVTSCLHFDPSCFSNATCTYVFYSFAFCWRSRNFWTPRSYMTEDVESFLAILLLRDVTDVSFVMDLSVDCLSEFLFALSLIWMLICDVEFWFYLDGRMPLNWARVLLTLLTLRFLRAGLKEQSLMLSTFVFSCSCFILLSLCSSQILVLWYIFNSLSLWTDVILCPFKLI